MIKKGIFLAAACVSTLALNAMEWQSVFKEDFGGNSLDAPAYGKQAVGLRTDNYPLFVGTPEVNVQSGNVSILLKAAEKTYVAGELWSDVSRSLVGNQPMTKGSDHTMAGNTDKGYFLFVEAKKEKEIYNRTVSIPSGNEKFRVSTWVSCAIQWANSGWLKLEVKSPAGKVVGEKSLYLGPTTSTLNWKELAVEINDATRNYNSVTVSISPDDASDCLFYAIDDIAVSVWRPTLDITSTVYKGCAELEMNYRHSELSQFFGNDCKGVIYEWKKRSLNSDKWETLGGGQYYNGAYIFFRWNCYIPKRDNGFYKLVFSKNGKTVVQTVEMNYTQDELNALGRNGEIVTTFRSLDVEDEDSEATADVTVYSDQNQLFVSKEAQEYTIYDMSGRVVAQSNQLPVNISVLKAGVYVVDVDGSRVKFIKK
ncbi:MAG: T9SS type A sorting domain-containing protein [Paludibacteraceae bacterium]|nr:T9SS type A sorting domain-containing protein [Paludibacteraceae bacterium]